MYSVCSDLYLYYSPEEFWKRKNDQPIEKTKNFRYVYLDNRKEFMCIDLETYEQKIIYTSQEDIRSFQIRNDGTILMVYQTDLIDILEPTEEGLYECVQQITIDTLQNYKIYLSKNKEEDYVFIRTLKSIFKPSEESELPEEVATREDIDPEKDVYCESIKKFKLSKNEEEGNYNFDEIGELLVYSNHKKQL